MNTFRMQAPFFLPVFYVINTMSATLEKLMPEAKGSANKAVCVDTQSEAVVIVGSGPVGMQFVNELLLRNVGAPVVVYGSEPVQPYNRVRLSDYLAGVVHRETLVIEEPVSEQVNVEYRYNCAVEWIDKNEKVITDASGRLQRYSKLVLATGSTPFIPMFGNRHYKGIYTFRTLSEADELLTRKLRTRHTVVIGGGLLGLETARAMQAYHTEITIVEHSKWLMMQQLDEQGSAYLERFIENSGIKVVLDDSVISVTGNGRVEGVTLRSGVTLACDTLIIAAGVRPDIALAKDAGLACRKGIRVDDQLETSQPDIYAIGECAEHKDSVYGLVKPGFEQAAVLADRLTGGKSRYHGSITTTQLKVMSQAVFSAGRTGVDEESGASVNEYVYSDHEAGLYRKIRVFGNRIIGAIAVGEWHEGTLLNEAIQDKRKIWFWHLLRFRSSGNIWGNAEDVDVSTWPASATVCNCTGVTRGRLSIVLGNGCESVECLTKITRAGSVCGSCKPLLSELLGEQGSIEPVRAWRGLLGLSALTLTIAALFFFIWRVPYASSVQHEIRWDMLWRDSLLKQISGFTILGLVVIGLMVSLRKRVTKFTLGDYDLWRISHVVLGIAALVALVLHTGFRFGNELNLLLMINFLLLTVAGANGTAGGEEAAQTMEQGAPAAVLVAAGTAGLPYLKDVLLLKSLEPVDEY
jgi:nitrite reductase (NADH) large subunit